MQADTPPSSAGPPVVGQHSWSEPPQAVQEPAVPVAVSRPEHAKPLSQVALPVPQHDCPEAPQAEQMLPVDFSTHETPEAHAVAPAPVQQAWPSAPQALQVPAVPCAASRPEQAKPVSHVPLLPVPQQGSPEPPQEVEAEQTLPLAERLHVNPLSQVPPPPPPAPGQQVWPEPPHALHVLAPASTPVSAMQPRPLWHAFVPAQQAAPAAPQSSHVLVVPVRLQARPVLHALFEQHPCPDPPHEVQVRPPPSTPAAAAQIRDDWHVLP